MLRPTRLAILLLAAALAAPAAEVTVAAVRPAASKLSGFVPPEDFVQRLGLMETDHFFSGTFEREGRRFGYLRIPTRAPHDPETAIHQLSEELRFFAQNVDEVILDRTAENRNGMTEFTAAALNYIRETKEFNKPIRLFVEPSNRLPGDATMRR